MQACHSIDSQPLRKAFSLIELLVVIAIVGVLAGMLFPAVQAVRESARKTVCQNNLRQIGIGLHSYHGAHQELPVGCLEWRAWGAPPTRRQIAWSAFLLPFLEQSSLAVRIQWDQPFDSAANQAIGQLNVSVYLCPSESQERSNPGRISYGGVFGELIVDTQQDDGMFLNETEISFSEIHDGLTNTIGIAEDVGGPDNHWINGRNIFVQSGGVNDPSAWSGDNEIRSDHRGGAMVLFMDTRPVFLSQSIDKILLGRLITRDKGESVSLSF